MRIALTSAALTGAFCAGFVVLIDKLAGMLPLAPVIMLSFLSGFLGSLFARFVMGRKND